MVRQYWELPGLQDYYLEDSWVLAIDAHPASLCLDLDVVLRESHPEYRPPRPGEQYCYRRGRLRFEPMSDLEWTGRGAPPAVDATGERDLGSVDALSETDGVFLLEGDFGRLVLRSGLPSIELESDAENVPR